MSHFEIKRQLLSHISSMIQKYEIGAVLISGDLELDSADNLIPFLTECLMLGSKVFLVFGEHNTKESRQELMLKTKRLDGLKPDKTLRGDLSKVIFVCVYYQLGINHH